MATPNYGYEKRQRELAKKRKAEEKKLKKQQGGSTSPDDAPDAPGPDAAGAQVLGRGFDVGEPLEQRRGRLRQLQPGRRRLDAAAHPLRHRMFQL